MRFRFQLQAGMELTDDVTSQSLSNPLVQRPLYSLFGGAISHLMIRLNDFIQKHASSRQQHIFPSLHRYLSLTVRRSMKTDAIPFRRRIFRAPEADYMHEWDTALTAHRDPHLAAIRSNGFDAVWLRGVLREIVRTDLFPELAPRAEKHLHTLNTLLA